MPAEEVFRGIAHNGQFLFFTVILGKSVRKSVKNFPEIVKAWEKGEITLKEALKQSNMGQTSFYRRRREYNLVHPVKKQPS